MFLSTDQLEAIADVDNSAHLTAASGYVAIASGVDGGIADPSISRYPPKQVLSVALFYACRACSSKLFDDCDVVHGSCRPYDQADLGDPSLDSSASNRPLNAQQHPGNNGPASLDGGVVSSSAKAFRGKNLTASRPSHMDGCETCTSVFVKEPLTWMNKANLKMNSDKITCFKCKKRLGTFSWSGTQCSCGSWISPAFQFNTSRVDHRKLD